MASLLTAFAADFEKLTQCESPNVGSAEPLAALLMASVPDVETQVPSVGSVEPLAVLLQVAEAQELRQQ